MDERKEFPVPDVAKVQLAIEYIEDHLSEKLVLQQIAEEVGVSPFHLHRVFSKTLGLTIHGYLRRRQMTEAARRLAFSDIRILDIALLAGYESQQAFSNIFKALYKRPPNGFRNGGVFYPLQLQFEFNIPSMWGKSLEDIHWRVALARERDIPQWMGLVRLVIDGYPFLDETEHIGVLKRAITEDRAWIVTDGSTIGGIMLYSRSSGNIDFLGIHPLLHQQGIDRLLLGQALSVFLEGPPQRKGITITTYREGDVADTKYRRMILELGFVESEALVEFGYPTQEFLFTPDSLR